MLPRTIITYLVEGISTGIKTIEFSNRLIKGIIIPRKNFKEALNLRKNELSYTGIYFLFGNDDNEDNMAYIGQAINLGKRLMDHYKDDNKGFWNYAVAFIYKDGSLNETDINYLERMVIAKAKKVDRYKIKNGTTGNNGNIPEYRIPDMNEFIEDIETLLSSVGYPILTEIISSQEKKEEMNMYYITSKGSKAKGVYTTEGFFVLKGSKGPKELVPSEVTRKGYAYRNRPKLIERNIIKEEGNEIVFVENHLFSSPSGASDIILGRSSNGRDERKDKEGKTLGEKDRDYNEIDEMGFKVGEKYESLQDLPNFKIGRKYSYKRKGLVSAFFVGEDGEEQEFPDKEMAIYRKREK